MAEEQPGPGSKSARQQGIWNTRALWTSINPHHNIIYIVKCHLVKYLSALRYHTFIGTPATFEEIEEQMLCTCIDIEIPCIYANFHV